MDALVMPAPKKYTDPEWRDVPSALGTQEVADLLRVHINTVKNLITKGKIPAYKVGRIYRINKVDLMEYVGLKSKEAQK